MMLTHAVVSLAACPAYADLPRPQVGDAFEYVVEDSIPGLDRYRVELRARSGRVFTEAQAFNLGPDGEFVVSRTVEVGLGGAVYTAITDLSGLRREVGAARTDLARFEALAAGEDAVGADGSVRVSFIGCEANPAHGRVSAYEVTVSPEDEQANRWLISHKDGWWVSLAGASRIQRVYGEEG